MSDDPLKPGGALEGRLFRGFLERLSEAREPEPGECIGVWKILRELGRGGTGVVYLAERADGAFSQRVALKWLRADRPVPGGREALARERELLSSIDHPGIARLIDGGTTEDGMLWFAMDYIDGETIDQYAPSRPLRERLSLVATLCRAAHHAHRRGLIHGDIKPSNVVVDAHGRPRLIDFGISRIKGAAGASSYGLTPDYASPEQRRRESLTTASDIWQLGRLLEDMIDGSRVPADLHAIVNRATAEVPEERYASAAAMGADIEAWIEQRPVSAHRAGAGYRLARLVQRNRLVSAVIATAMAVIIFGGVWMTLQLADERDHARAEAERAEAALEQTEAALARAEALGDFLADLFRATRPDRPREELPSTEEILERGAERAMDPDSAPPVERFDMLSTIGRVYQARARYEDAGPLFDAALALARESDGLRPLDRARALEQQAGLMIATGEPLEAAERLLIEAEGMLADAADAWETLVRVRVTRTWVERHRGRHDRALALVEPLWWQMPPPDAVSPPVRAGLLDSLAGLHAAVGHLERASQFRAMATEAFRSYQGEDGQGYIVSLANSVGLELARGRFVAAERLARRAIAGYDRIYPDPVDYRASLRRTLARVLLAQGQVEAAFAELERSGDEYAAAWEMPEWPLYFTMRGHFNARLGRVDAAAADFERAHGLLLEHEDEFDRRLLRVSETMLAWGRCLQGRGAPDLLDLESEEAPFQRTRYRALWHEARAACALGAGRHEPALRAVDRALVTENGPGTLVATANRRMLRARILSALGRPDEAAAELESADRLFAAADLAAHPLSERIETLRAGLD